MITYQIGNDLPLASVIAVYQATTLGERRPLADFDRMSEMIANSNLVISAWSDGELIGIARALTDFNYVTYLSDLVVKDTFQRQGIGKTLIVHIQTAVPNAMLVLLAAPQAVNYYPNIGLGFEPHDSAWVIRQK